MDDLQLGLMYLSALKKDQDINDYLKSGNGRIIIYRNETNIGYGFFNNFADFKYRDPISAIYVEENGEIKRIISLESESVLTDLLRENNVNLEILRENLESLKQTIKMFDLGDEENVRAS